MTTDAEPRPEFYLEDFEVGQSFESGEHVITADEIIAFATQFDPQPFHTDPVAAVDTFFGGLAASGWHTASLTMRMLVTEGPMVAGGNVGAGGQLRWPTATRPGDRLHIRVTVESVTPSKSRPERGMVGMRVETLTSEGELRQLFVVNSLAFARPAGAQHQP